jgi:hypothetical protein
VRLERLSLDGWNELSEQAHLVCHKEIRPKSMNTIDFAIVIYDDEKLLSYATVIEMEKNIAHMQHGGAFPEIKGTAMSFRSYKSIIENLKSDYEGLTTNIENINTPMLKFALNVGFIPVGIDCHTFGIYEGTYVHMYMDTKKEN